MAEGGRLEPHRLTRPLRSPLPGPAVGSPCVTPGTTGAGSPSSLDHAPFASAPFSSVHHQQLLNVDSRRKERKAVHFTRVPKCLRILSAYLFNFNDDKVAPLSRGQVQSRKPVPCSAASLFCPEPKRQNAEGGVLWVFDSLFNKCSSPLPFLCIRSYHSTSILRAYPCHFHPYLPKF